MAERAEQLELFRRVGRAQVSAELSGSETSSDGGGALLLQTERRFGLSAGWAKCRPASRTVSASASARHVRRKARTLSNGHHGARARWTRSVDCCGWLLRYSALCSQRPCWIGPRHADRPRARPAKPRVGACAGSTSCSIRWRAAVSAFSPSPNSRSCCVSDVPAWLILAWAWPRLARV